VLAGEQYLICFSNWSSVTTVVPLEFGGTATVSCDPVFLPVELSVFNAEARLNDVLLSWITATECNTSHFEVQRSLDLVDWTTFSTLPAAGNCQEQREYSALDGSPIAGQNFYRLRVVHLDGSGESSAVVSVHWLPAGPLVHPNPSTGGFWVETAGAISVIDATGREVAFSRDVMTEKAQYVRIGRPGLFLVRSGEGDALRVDRVLVE
jgi:hypothetical protein